MKLFSGKSFVCGTITLIKNRPTMMFQLLSPAAVLESGENDWCMLVKITLGKVDKCLCTVTTRAMKMSTIFQ
jgi:hypothetical protein